MVEYPRTLPIESIVAKRSIFLFGPRQTGKSTLLRKAFPNALYLDLLSKDVENLITRTPEKIEQIARAERKNQIIIDEVQKAPSILNEVHRLIEMNKNTRFILTGSSTRKIHQAGTNMLGGRAKILDLFPITYQEFIQSGDTRPPLQTLIQWGGLPSVLNSSEPHELLEDYVRSYIYGEIKSETHVRSLDNYARFLDSVALMNTEQMNFSEIASDAQLPVQTVKNYFQILEDTLLGKFLPSYRRTQKRKAVATSKFYLFDIGIAHAILTRWEIKKGTPEYGKALEHLIWRELTSYMGYNGNQFDLFYWRTSTQKEEVDFIVQKRGTQTPICAIEVKAKSHIAEKDLKGLQAFSEEFPTIKKIVVSLEMNKRVDSNENEIWPVLEFLEALWKNRIF
jgi:predicted AAA+ superfamily ATPase